MREIKKKEEKSGWLQQYWNMKSREIIDFRNEMSYCFLMPRWKSCKVLPYFSYVALRENCDYEAGKKIKLNNDYVPPRLLFTGVVIAFGNMH